MNLNTAAKQRIYRTAEACSKRIRRENLSGDAAEKEITVTERELVSDLAGGSTPRGDSIRRVFRASL